VNDVDDVGFILAVLKDLAARFPEVDSQRMCVVSHSHEHHSLAPSLIHSACSNSLSCFLMTCSHGIPTRPVVTCSAVEALHA
jgi:hypothetical protein